MGVGAVQSQLAVRPHNAGGQGEYRPDNGHTLMSYDFNTGLQACTHEINAERYVIDTTDFKTLHLAADPSLNMRAPINGQAQVQMFISGEFVQQNDPTYGYSFFPDT